MKRYQEIWIEEVFIVDSIVYGNPTTCKMKDQDNEPIQGTFYEQELQLIVKSKTSHRESDWEKKESNRVLLHVKQLIVTCLKTKQNNDLRYIT